MHSMTVFSSSAVFFLSAHRVFNIDALRSRASMFMEPKWVVLKTPSYAFGGRIRRCAKVKVNKVKTSIIQHGGCTY